MMKNSPQLIWIDSYNYPRIGDPTSAVDSFEALKSLL